jgi:hypothetical protein
MPDFCGDVVVAWQAEENVLYPFMAKRMGGEGQHMAEVRRQPSLLLHSARS